jgi:hypothetical protein
MHSDLANLSFGVEFETILPRGFSLSFAATSIANRTGFPVNEGLRTAVTNPNTPAWKVVRDGSIRTRNGEGAEFVSPVLKGQSGLDQVRAICDAFEALGITVNKSCGFHVHVGGFRADLDFFKAITKLYARFEPAIDQLHPLSRRANNFCKGLRNGARDGSIDSAASLDQVIYHATGEPSGSFGRRYYKLNLAAFLKHSTVEFRQHAGTVDATKAVSWIIICLKMVRAAQLGKTGIGGTDNTARDFSSLPVKARRVAEFITRPAGATREEIIAGTEFAALSVNRQARLAGLAVRTIRERGTDRFFAETTNGAAIPVNLAGFSQLIEADESEAAFIRARAIALHQATAAA